MRRNQLIGKANKSKNTNQAGEEHPRQKEDVKESKYRPTTTVNHTMSSLEKQLAVRKTATRTFNSAGHHVQKFLLSCFGPMQGEHFTPTNAWIIHPNSVASSVLLLTSGTLLIYSAIQVPFDIGFFWDSELCDGAITFVKFNVFVDTFFVFEVLVTFFVGVWYKGEYNDSLATIAFCYIRGRFTFDVITSMPTSWFDLIAFNSCSDKHTESSNSVTDILKFIRLLKPLRLFKILDRILRISPQILQIAKLTFGVTLLVHLLACLFWLLKTQYAADFTDFVEKFNVEGGVARQWLLAMYFVNTIFTTVGFGDVTGTNNVERTFCIIVMWIGTGVFAIIINGLQQAGAEMNERNRERNQAVEKVVRFMRERSVPAWMEEEVRAWIAFRVDRNTAATERAQVLKSLPPKLRNSLVLQINSRMFSKSWVFGQLSHPDSNKLMTQLVLKTKNVIISKGQLIASHSEDCALPPQLPFDGGPPVKHGIRLYIVEIGAVALSVWINGEAQMLEGKTLTPGHFFGEKSLVGGKWGIPEETQFEFRAIENTELISLDKETVDEVMAMFPEELRMEMEYHASRWRSRDPHVEDMRFQILLKIASGVSREFRSKRMQVLWEKLAYQLITLHRKDGMMGNLLFSFSMPTRTANPLQAMRARPDWNIPSIANSRRASSIGPQKKHRSNSQLSLRSNARSFSRNGGERTASLMSYTSVEKAQTHVTSMEESYEAGGRKDGGTETLSMLQSVHTKLAEFTGSEEMSESASCSSGEEHFAKENGMFCADRQDQSIAQNESDEVCVEDIPENLGRRVSIGEVVYVHDIPETRNRRDLAGEPWGPPRRVGIVTPSNPLDVDVNDILSCNGNTSHLLTGEATSPEFNLRNHDFDRPELSEMHDGNTTSDSGSWGMRDDELHNAKRSGTNHDETARGGDSRVRTDDWHHADESEVQDDTTASGGSRVRSRHSDDLDDAERSEMENGVENFLRSGELGHFCEDLQDDDRFASLLAPKPSSIPASSSSNEGSANGRLQPGSPGANADQGTVAASRGDVLSPTGSIQTPTALGSASRQPVDAWTKRRLSNDRDGLIQLPRRTDRAAVTSEVVLLEEAFVTSEVFLLDESKTTNGVGRIQSGGSGHEEKIGVMLENRAASSTRRHRSVLEKFQSRIGFA